MSRLRGDDYTFSSQDNCRSQPRPDGVSPPSNILARVVPADEPWLTEAGERLRRGKLVAFPTGNAALRCGLWSVFGRWHEARGEVPL